MLDRANARDEVHLRAALAVWEYCEASAAYIFATGTGDPLSDRILAALKASTSGLTRTDIRALVGNRVESDRITRALSRLAEAGLAEEKTEATGGRPIERWALTP